jgi:hypothetical protein
LSTVFAKAIDAARESRMILWDVSGAVDEERLTIAVKYVEKLATATLPAARQPTADGGLAHADL